MRRGRTANRIGTRLEDVHTFVVGQCGGTIGEQADVIPRDDVSGRGRARDVDSDAGIAGNDVAIGGRDTANRVVRTQNIDPISGVRLT